LKKFDDVNTHTETDVNHLYYKLHWLQAGSRANKSRCTYTYKRTLQKCSLIFTQHILLWLLFRLKAVNSNASSL